MKNGVFRTKKQLFQRKNLFLFIKKTAVTIPFEILVGDLSAEFFTHTFVFRKLSDPTGTISPFRDQPFGDLFHDFLIFVQSDFHFVIPYIYYLSRFPGSKPPVRKRRVRKRIPHAQTRIPESDFRHGKGKGQVRESHNPLNPFSLKISR